MKFANDEIRDEKAITRGCKAINILQNMTARIPQLIEQSHLESNEGKFLLGFLIRPLADFTYSLVGILAASLPSSDNAMHQPLPRRSTTRVLGSSEGAFVARAHLE